MCCNSQLHQDVCKAIQTQLCHEIKGGGQNIVGCVSKYRTIYWPRGHREGGNIVPHRHSYWQRRQDVCQYHLMTIQIYSSGIIWTISSANWPLEFGSAGMPKCMGNHTYLGLTNNWGICNPKIVFKICEGISCSALCVKEFNVIVHKKFPLYSHTKFWPFSSPKPLANLVVEVGTRHSHQILLRRICLLWGYT